MPTIRKIKIALIMGGLSSERDVSFNTGKNIFENLDRNKYSVNIYDPKFDLLKLIHHGQKKDF